MLTSIDVKTYFLKLNLIFKLSEWIMNNKKLPAKQNY